jgi:hypothetical protein
MTTQPDWKSIRRPAPRALPGGVYVESIQRHAAAYTCPVCGVPDASAYLRCNRPDCTDGRDPANPNRPSAHHWNAPFLPTPAERDPRPWWKRLLGWS